MLNKQNKSIITTACLIAGILIVPALSRSDQKLGLSGLGPISAVQSLVTKEVTPTAPSEVLDGWGEGYLSLREEHFNTNPSRFIAQMDRRGDSCPKTVGEWEHWRLSLTLALTSGYFVERNDRGSMILKSMRSCGMKPDHEVIRRKMMERQPDIMESIYSCYDRLYTFINQLDEKISESDRIAELTSIPKELNTPDFTNLMGSPETVSQAMDYIHELNKSRAPDKQIKMVRFNSELIGAPENNDSRGRLLLFFPGDPEKWVQYAFNQKDSGVDLPICNVSVVAVEQTAGKDGGRVAHLRDHLYHIDDKRREWCARVNPDNPHIALDENKGQTDCARCHGGNGVIPIHFEGWKQNPQAPIITELNRIANLPTELYGNPLTIAAKAPLMGPMIDRSDAFIESCSKMVPGFDEIKKDEMKFAKYKYQVNEGMKCAQCHNASEKAEARPIRFPYGFSDLTESILASHIQSGNMPKNAKIPFTKTELQGIYNCLITEYYGDNTSNNPGLFGEFLMEASCREGTQPQLLSEAKELLSPTASGLGARDGTIILPEPAVKSGSDRPPAGRPRSLTTTDAL